MSTVSYVAILLGVLVIEIYGHSYVTKPTARNPFYSCRIGGPPEYPVNCPGPCDADYNARQAITTVARGASLKVEWPRNNHAGGFIRLSWISGNTPETHANFDAAATFYSCHEVGCQSDAGAGDDGGDSNGSDGTKNPCTLTTTVPTHLADGRYTMQWAWFGGTGGYLGDYYSCVNFQVSGGAAVTAKQLPVFKGGDVSNPGRNDLCEFWGTNILHYCISEPCSDICKDNTAPTGHCNWPQANGRPYIAELANVPSNYGQCRTYTSSGTAQTFPRPSGSLVSTINVPDSFNVATLSVNNVNGYSDWMGAFDLYLENPAGSRILVMNRYGCDTSANYVFNFNETASAVRWACPPTSASALWKPVDTYTWFYNTPSNGNWKLVLDNKADVNGRLNGWSINLCAVATTPDPTKPIATSAVVSPTILPTTSDDNQPTISVKITVSLPMAPSVLDITTFIYDIVKVLNIPTAAIQEVVVDFDKSTSTQTIIEFRIVNVVGKDGNRIDPIKVAQELKDKAAANDVAIQSSIMIKGMSVVSTEVTEEKKDKPFVETDGFIILIAVVGGVVLVGAIAGVVGFLVYRKKKFPYKSWF